VRHLYNHHLWRAPFSSSTILIYSLISPLFRLVSRTFPFGLVSLQTQLSCRDDDEKNTHKKKRNWSGVGGGGFLLSHDLLFYSCVGDISSL
jgi:hypothetical protein